MKRITVSAVFLSVLILALTGSVGPLGLRASAGGTPASLAALPQVQTPRPIRTLPGLQEIRVWIGLVTCCLLSPSASLGSSA
jgi:hypothetical protein